MGSIGTTIRIQLCSAYLWLPGKEGMNKMEATIVGYIGTPKPSTL